MWRLPISCGIILVGSYLFFPARPENLQLAKERIIAYYESGRFQEEIAQVAARAHTLLCNRPVAAQDLIIFDVDETVLSEYCNFKAIQFGYIPKLSHEWVLAAHAPAMPEVKKLYDALVQQGYHIIFLTGRQYNEYKATRKNLLLRGFSTFDKLIVRSQDQERLPAAQYKAAERIKLTTSGYTIVGSVGDQWSDMEGGNCGIFIKIPNYAYVIP